MESLHLPIAFNFFVEAKGKQKLKNDNEAPLGGAVVREDEWIIIGKWDSIFIRCKYFLEIFSKTVKIYTQYY